MNIKNSRCQELGVCQGLGPNDCPDCDSFECEVVVPGLQPVADRRQVDRRYTFAPGVIEGAQPTQAFVDVDEWFPLSLAETLKLACVLAVLGLAAGYLVERFA
ncbi:hypothetical protein [Rhodoferax sp. BLA1]|uniref:hypothetical protein n=1 Tax=Rhodoferax sp. BLA1 TaxID=2576062 RepID=UPI0015D2C03A|nr:hypothetical protein [Rhodoferax sp. BLA1]